jgi:endonuclease/exonuclease/phosphatase family metal-dependent hydrolase
MNGIIRVGTINLLNDLSRWPERRVWLVQELAPLGLDLIGFQEVTNPLGHSTAHQLAEDLGEYEVFVCPKTGLGRSREGIAILSKLPVERHDTLDLKTQQRTAQLVEISVGGRPVVFVNGHYYWHPGAHSARVRQVERLVAWLSSAAPDASVIAGGDFNGTPESPAIARMRRAYRSAHEVRHGREPEFTYPSPLTSRLPIRSAVTRGLLRLFSNRAGAGAGAGNSWRGTLDYLFVSRDLRVVECDVILNRPAPDDPSLYPSDHYGLAATLEIASTTES